MGFPAFAAFLGLLRSASAITTRRPHGVYPRPAGAFGHDREHDRGRGVPPQPPQRATTTTVGPAAGERPLTLPKAWDEHRIPYQLVLTAGTGTLDDLPPRMRENFDQTLALNPGLRVRFLNDTACAEFIAAHWPDTLLSAFRGEDFGPYRGDICRAAVIAVEGGFYADLDVQFRLPFSQFVDASTVFLTSFDYSCHILNALFAAEPRSFVMQSVVDSIHEWYSRNRTEGKQEWMGTKTMYDGLYKALRRECPNVNIATTQKLQFPCGRQRLPYGQSIRLYREKRLRCAQDEAGEAAEWVEEECPAARKVPAYSGQRFGIFEPGQERRLVAWSRFEGCEGWHCSNRRMAAHDAANASSDADKPACKA